MSDAKEDKASPTGDNAHVSHHEPDRDKTQGHSVSDTHGAGHGADAHGHGDAHGHEAPPADMIPEKSWQDALLSLYAVLCLAGLCFMMITWSGSPLAPVLHEVGEHGGGGEAH